MSVTYRMRLAMLGWYLSVNAFAGSSATPTLIMDTEGLDNRWSIITSLGYGQNHHMYRSDGKTAIGRLAFAAELLTTQQAAFGLELGVQTGNNMRLAFFQTPLATLGCMVRTTMKPMLDLLVTAHANLVDESLLFTQVKGGITYRHWQVDSFLINSKSALAGEVQAGLGYPLTEITNLNLLYQGVFGGNPKLHLNPEPEASTISNLPVQHGLLLGFSIIT